MTPLETFEHAIGLLDLDAFRREQTEARVAGRYLGVGTSTYCEPTSTVTTALTVPVFPKL